MNTPQAKIALFILYWLGCTSLYSGDWPQWRGEDRTAMVSGEWPAAVTSENLQKVWSIELAPSYSTPIVVGNRIFTTETRDEKSEVVQALDRATGQQIWETGWDGAMKVPFFAAANGSWIRATPAADDQDLFVAGMRDVLVCLDQESGKIKWQVDFVSKLKSALPAFGFVSSPLLDDDHVYVQAGGGLIKLKKSDGSIVWRVLDDGGGMSGSAFSSPVFETIDDQLQILVQTREFLAGVNPEDGTVLWKQPIEAFRGMNIVTPVRFENSLFTSTYGGGSFLIGLAKSDSVWTATETWRNKLQGYMSTPVVLDGFAYLHLRNGRFACIELKTGEEKWVTTPFGGYWSMVTNGNQILALDEEGDLLLIDPSPEEFKLVSKLHISDSPTWAHLVVADQQLMIRALDRLTVYNWQE